MYYSSRRWLLCLLLISLLGVGLSAYAPVLLAAESCPMMGDHQSGMNMAEMPPCAEHVGAQACVDCSSCPLCTVAVTAVAAELQPLFYRSTPVYPYLPRRYHYLGAMELPPPRLS